VADKNVCVLIPPLGLSKKHYPDIEFEYLSYAIKSAINIGSLRVIHTETLNIHYARTTQAWIDNMVANKEKLIKEYGENIYRTYIYSWNMARAALEAGFTLVQIIFEKKPYGEDYRDSLYSGINFRDFKI